MRPPALPTHHLDHLFGFRLAVAEGASRRLFQQHVGSPYDLRPVEFALLMLLLDSEQASPKQLAQAVQAKAPQVTVMLDRLSERRLVERRRSTTDGRAVQVTLTDEGRAFAQRAHASSKEIEAPLHQRLSAGERAMLRELLDKLARPGAAAKAAG